MINTLLLTCTCCLAIQEDIQKNINDTNEELVEMRNFYQENPDKNTLYLYHLGHLHGKIHAYSKILQEYEFKY